MTTRRQLSKAALSLPSAAQTARGDDVAFEVAGRPFARTVAGGRVQLWLRASDVAELVEEQSTAEPVRRGGGVTATVELGAIDGQQLNRWVRQAWKHRAPRRLVVAAEAAERAEPGEGDLPRSIGRPATRALAEAGITTLAGVQRLSEAELAGLHGVGPKAVAILRDALSDRGRR